MGPLEELLRAVSEKKRQREREEGARGVRGILAGGRPGDDPYASIMAAVRSEAMGKMVGQEQAAGTELQMALAQRQAAQEAESARAENLFKLHTERMKAAYGAAGGGLQYAGVARTPRISEGLVGQLLGEAGGGYAQALQQLAAGAPQQSPYYTPHGPLPPPGFTPPAPTPPAATPATAKEALEKVTKPGGAEAKKVEVEPKSWLQQKKQEILAAAERKRQEKKKRGGSIAPPSRD